MNRLSTYLQARILASLVEGNTGRGVARQLELNKRTVSRNQLWIGEACQRFHDRMVRHLKCTHLQADEAWSILWAKEKNLPVYLRGSREHGEMWTWMAICPHTRLLVSWLVGKHTYSDCLTFAHDIASRIPGRLQITTDQLAAYRMAFEEVFGSRLDYATIAKDMELARKTPDGQFEQTEFIKNRKFSTLGNPDLSKATTTTIESHNSSVRHYNRRYARRTKAFSKKLRNKQAALALFSTYFNFCYVVPKLRCTPAMEAGLTDKLWRVDDLIEAINVEESRKIPV